MAQSYAPFPPGQQALFESELTATSRSGNQDGNNAVDIDEIAAEIREEYGDEVLIDEHLDQDFDLQQTENEAYAAFDTAVNKLQDKSSEGKICASCAKPRRVINADQFKRGQHISMPGQHSTKYIKKIRKLIGVYHHHAIVKEVVSVTGFLITMILIHFNQCGDELSVFEETKTYDLNEKELYIVDYVHHRYDADQIVKRAESILEKKETIKSYGLLSNNCEHFATWCVVGEGESFQVQSYLKRAANAVARMSGIGTKIAKAILRIAFISADEVAASLKIAVPEFVLGGAAAVYLIYCIIMTVVYSNDYRKGQLCWSCYKGKLQDLWFTFGAFGVTSVVTFLFMHFAIPLMSTGIGIPIAILLILLSIGLQIAVPKIRKALSSPFTVDRKQINHLNELSEGDVISFRYYGFRHTSIVSNVDADSGQTRFIHYGTSSLCGTRTIIEENIQIDVSKMKVMLLDCTRLNTFSKDEVISRAKSRIGETKWKLFGNRADNFAYWAKVKTQYDEDFDLNSTTSDVFPSSKVSLFIEEREIHRHEDLKIGDVVKSNVIGKFDNTGILSSLRYLDGSNGRKFEMEVITYNFAWVVTRKRYTIDLNTDRLFVKMYNPAQCHAMEQRAEYAKRIVDEKREWWTTRGFIEYCIERKASESES